MTTRFRSLCRAAALASVCVFAVAAAPSTKPASLAGQSHQFESLASPGQLLRPRGASSAENTPIVLYPQQDWKCMSWKLESVGDDGDVRLVNYFTHKTFFPGDGEAAAVTQHAAAKPASAVERWKIVPTTGDAFRLDHAATGRTLTVGADGSLTVGPWTGANTQQWKLLDKPAHFTG